MYQVFKPEMFDGFFETIIGIDAPFVISGILILCGGFVASRKIHSFIHKIRKG